MKDGKETKVISIDSLRFKQEAKIREQIINKYTKNSSLPYLDK